MMNKKGQGAMEYLMTYGWAIIIVIIVGVALWRLGIFTPHTSKTSQGFDAFFIGSDFRIRADGEAMLIIKNKDIGGRQLFLNSVVVGSQDSCNGDTGWRNVEANWNVTCTGIPSGKAGSAYTGVGVSINYAVEGVSYTDAGTISGTYESAA